VGEEARSLVGEAEEERRRNLAHNAKVLRLFAELAAKNDRDYWRAYLNFINDFYRYVWRRLEEDPLFRETYMKILAERAKRPRREPPQGQGRSPLKRLRPHEARGAVAGAENCGATYCSGVGTSIHMGCYYIVFTSAFLIHRER